jgi:hypothetical protein
MTRNDYKKKHNPQIKSVIKTMGLEFDKDEYEKIVDDAYEMVLSGQKLTKTNVVDGPMHKEMIRSAVVSAYKRTHWVPSTACFLNLLSGVLLLGGVAYFTAPFCPMLSMNQAIQLATYWIIMYGTWKKHVPLWEKIQARKEKVRWYRFMPI